MHININGSGWQQLDADLVRWSHNLSPDGTRIRFYNSDANEVMRIALDPDAVLECMGSYLVLDPEYDLDTDADDALAVWMEQEVDGAQEPAQSEPSGEMRGQD
jgi:hypothetical protein